MGNKYIFTINDLDSYSTSDSDYTKQIDKTEYYTSTDKTPIKLQLKKNGSIINGVSKTVYLKPAKKKQTQTIRVGEEAAFPEGQSPDDFVLLLTVMTNSDLESAYKKDFQYLVDRLNDSARKYMKELHAEDGDVSKYDDVIYYGSDGNGIFAYISKAAVDTIYCTDEQRDPEKKYVGNNIANEDVIDFNGNKLEEGAYKVYIKGKAEIVGFNNENPGGITPGSTYSGLLRIPNAFYWNIGGSIYLFIADNFKKLSYKQGNTILPYPEVIANNDAPQDISSKIRIDYISYDDAYNGEATWINNSNQKEPIGGAETHYWVCGKNCVDNQMKVPTNNSNASLENVDTYIVNYMNLDRIVSADTMESINFFVDSANVKEITIPGVTILGTGAIRTNAECTLYLTDNLTEVQSNAITGAANCKICYVPQNFDKDILLEKGVFILPPNIQTIGDNAFSGVKCKILDLTYNDNLGSVGKEAFAFSTNEFTKFYYREDQILKNGKILLYLPPAWKEIENTVYTLPPIEKNRQTAESIPIYYGTIANYGLLIGKLNGEGFKFKYKSNGIDEYFTPDSKYLQYWNNCYNQQASIFALGDNDSSSINQSCYSAVDFYCVTKVANISRYD